MRSPGNARYHLLRDQASMTQLGRHLLFVLNRPQSTFEVLTNSITGAANVLSSILLILGVDPQREGGEEEGNPSTQDAEADGFL